MPHDAYIYDAVRTPRGRGKSDGALYEAQPVDLLATVLRALTERNPFETALVQDVIIGCVTPIAEQGGVIARSAVLHAGWAQNVPGVQLDRFCASGLEAINTAAMQIASGWHDLVVAGGVESMSRLPMGSDGGAWFMDPRVNLESGFVPQGISADLIATIENFSRDDVDRYALQSQQRAAYAEQNGYFKSRVPVVDQNGLLLLDRDEHIRANTTMERLGNLAPAFEMMGVMGFDAVALDRYPKLERIDHVHTAGNSSGIVDGAAAVLIGNKEIGERLGLKPRAKILAGAVVGTEPTIMLTGPAPASHQALAKAKMNVRDVDLFEVNEAFAVVPLRFVRDMKLDGTENVNVNGGAIAMGHPLGATGAMLLGTLLDELERNDLETGLVTLCVGGGMGIATVVERA